MNLQKYHINSQPTHSRQATSLGKFYWSEALACAAVIGSILPAKAASFNFTYAPVATLNPMIGYEMAGKYWSNYLCEEIRQLADNFQIKQIREFIKSFQSKLP